VAAWTLDINQALQPVNVINFNTVFTMDVHASGRLKPSLALVLLSILQQLNHRCSNQGQSSSQQPHPRHLRPPISLASALWHTAPYFPMRRAIRSVSISRITFFLTWLLYLAVSYRNKHCTWDPIISNGVSISTFAKTGIIILSFYLTAN